MKVYATGRYKSICNWWIYKIIVLKKWQSFFKILEVFFRRIKIRIKKKKKGEIKVHYSKQ